MQAAIQLVNGDPSIILFVLFCTMVSAVITVLVLIGLIRPVEPSTTLLLKM